MSTLEPPARISKPGGAALWLARMQMKHGRKLVIALPYIWLILLFLLPFLIVFKISWRKWRGRSRRIPICWNGLTVSCRLRSISVIFATDRRSALFRSLSAIVTNCRYFHNLLPAAGLPAGVGGGAQQALHAQYPAAVGDPALVDVFLIRVYARMGILKNNGVLNNVLLWLGLSISR